MVEELYELGDHSEQYQGPKQKTEDRISEIKMLRSVLRETKLIKVLSGKISLTTKGKKLLASDHNELLRTVVQFLFTTFHTGWGDSFEDFNVGNMGRLYSLWLLHHFGTQWRDERFYANEYFQALPSMWKDTGMKYYSYEDLYSSRVFHRLFYIIGLCEFNEIINKEEPTRVIQVKKTPVLDMMFSFEEPPQVKGS